MPEKSVSEVIAEAAAKTAKDLGVKDEESTEQSGAKKEEETEETEEETSEEETEEETTETEDEVETQPKKSSKTVPMERFNEVYGKLKQMERYLAVMAANTQQPAKKEEPPAKEEPIPDLDELTNKELYQFIVKSLGKEMKGALKEAVSPLSQFVNSSVQEKADREVAGVAAKHADYFDHAEKMMDISNRNPNLTAEEVYFLAKGDKGSVTKSVVKRQKEKMDAKKKANTEKRSTSVDKITENTEFKTVRDAGLAMAKKLGLT